MIDTIAKITTDAEIKIIASWPSGCFIAISVLSSFVLNELEQVYDATYSKNTS